MIVNKQTGSEHQVHAVHARATFYQVSFINRDLHPFCVCLLRSVFFN